MARLSPYRKQPKSVTITGAVLMLLGAIGLFLYQPEQSTNAKQTPKQEDKITCQVLTVYDGDTLGCDLNRDHKIQKPEEEIRLLGIDTPEMHYSRKNRSHHTEHESDEPFAKEASELMTSLALQKTVYLTFDEERYDKYGRTLAYVSLDTKKPAQLCEAMLEKGYAKTLFIPPNFKYKKDFKAIAKQAKSRHLGLWRD